MDGNNIICVPFAFKQGACTGVNVVGDACAVYLENACVALVSAKYYNPGCRVCLATNLSKDSLPEEYLRILERANISILHIPFDSFRFADEYLWSLAFYKLCVLKHLCQMSYENICYMDTDVYIQGTFDGIWQECEQNVLLYDINHGLGVKDYRIICEEFESFGVEKKFLTHYGGEFFAASKEMACKFCEKCEFVFNRMQDRNFQTTKGDEFIVSLAAAQLKDMIKNAGAYVYRFWTGAEFRLVSTCYTNNRVVVLHMPDEKNVGMISLYEDYIKKGKIPKDRVVWKKCSLESLRMIAKMKKIVKSIIRR